MSDKSVRDELAELAEAVRELRDREVADELRSLRAEVEKLRAERAAHHCTCAHIHWYTSTVPGCAPYVLPQVWYGTVTSGSSDAAVRVTTSVAAAAGNPATLSISN